MILGDRKGLIGVMLGAGLLASVAMLPKAQGELIYDSQISGPEQGVNVDDRETERQILNSAQKARVTNQAAAGTMSALEPGSQPVTQVVVQTTPTTPFPNIQPQAAVMQPVQQPMQQQPQIMQPVQQMPQQVYMLPVPAMAPQTATVQAQQTLQAQAPVEVENQSKTEMMRRSRVREELKNEDILQERLEELRLRDERRRTQEVLGLAQENDPLSALPVAAVASPVVSPAVSKEQIVVPPVTERPGEPAPLVAGIQDQIIMTKATATLEDEEKVTFSVMPRAGLNNMIGNQNGFSVNGRYSAGVGIGVGVSDNLGVEFGYAFSEYGVASSNPYAGMSPYPTYGVGRPSETYALKQNVFDVGLKIHLLGQQAKLRPFLGGGAGFSKSYINYDNKIIDSYHQIGWNTPRDYEISSYLGYISGGFDLKVTKSVSIGTTFKYYSVLSARENQPLANYAFYTPNYYNGYYPSTYGQTGYYDEKQAAGSSLAKAGFYSIMAGVSFTF